MSLLACKEYVQPILTVLQSSNGLSGGSISEQVAERTALSETGAQETIADGTPRYIVRIKQARYWLKKQGFVASLPSGLWAITKAGAEFLSTTGGRPEKLSYAAKDGSRRRRTDPNAERPGPLTEELGEPPLERIDAAMQQIHEAVEADLLQRVIQLSPSFFERMVLQLLRAMGYVSSRGFVEHTGGPRDGGIDGILFLDRLGLERVYVQAKRWNDPVGSAVMHQFCGALSVNHAQKGVILTTSTFSETARGDAKKAASQTIRLVDGAELASLMIEFGIGVSRAKTITIPEIDQGFFTE